MARRSTDDAGATRRSFYHGALEPGERRLLARAAACAGLAEEIGLLRVLTHRLLAERPMPTRHLLEALALLVRATAVELRATVHGAGEGEGAAGERLDRVLAQLDALLDDPMGEGADVA